MFVDHNHQHQYYPLLMQIFYDMVSVRLNKIIINLLDESFVTNDDDDSELIEFIEQENSDKYNA
ncbi:hypothetical protein DERP_005126 [Dermatophagoides pteronyssinus]|uniref:Uncharacterized protein n=1 Tax=Dermatophagoides pteronyssinus TaxID=6956 RepID=A0ABQ8JUJ5_DERPT|nr:hypothetical protein DERP_005126 [Dermatophagoides pteronyssinus]